MSASGSVEWKLQFRGAESHPSTTEFSQEDEADLDSEDQPFPSRGQKLNQRAPHVHKCSKLKYAEKIDGKDKLGDTPTNCEANLSSTDWSK